MSQFAVILYDNNAANTYVCLCDTVQVAELLAQDLRDNVHEDADIEVLVEEVISEQGMGEELSAINDDYADDEDDVEDD